MAAAEHHNKPVFMYQTVPTACFALMMALTGCSSSEQTPQQVTPSAQTTAGLNSSTSSISTTSSGSAGTIVAPASGVENVSASSTSSQTTSSATAVSSAHSSSKSRIAVSSSISHTATSAPAEPVASKPEPETSNVSQSVSASATTSSISQSSAISEQSPPHASLDLESLEQRLRDTKAIGVFTKLSLKNQVDDLLDSFRAYYKGKAKPQLPDLRQRYDLLLMKLLTLLQDSDTRLAADIRSSREAIWDILKDPKKFAEIS